MRNQTETDLRGREFWENHYGQAERIWSGRVNSTLAAVLGEIQPGTALDLGCGEGGDVLWLASRGWDATGVDISGTAISRARQAAEDAGQLPGRARFLVADLETWDDRRKFDLVTVSFFHAPFEFQRDRVLRAALERLAPGGHLVVLSHGSHPASRCGAGHDGASAGHQAPNLVTVDGELRVLGLPAEGFRVLQANSVPRDVTGPDGQPATITDVIVVARREP